MKLRGCFLIWLRKIALVITTTSEEGRPVGKVDFNQTTEKMSNARSFSAWDGKANRAATDFGLVIVFQSSIASISFKMSVGVHQVIPHWNAKFSSIAHIWRFFLSCSCSMNVGFHSKISQIPRSLKIDEATELLLLTDPSVSLVRFASPISAVLLGSIRRS